MWIRPTWPTFPRPSRPIWSSSPTFTAITWTRAPSTGCARRTTAYVAPKALADRFPGATTILANGETKTVAGVSIQAVAAYNLTRGPAPGQFYHTKGRGNAYVLTLGGKKILLTGDTECTPEIKALTGIDVAFVTMNLPFTMTPQEAAECMKAVKPAVVYPVPLSPAGPGAGQQEPAGLRRRDAGHGWRRSEGGRVLSRAAAGGRARGPRRPGRRLNIHRFGSGGFNPPDPCAAVTRVCT